MWQKCPVCNGTGMATSGGALFQTNSICSVCQGRKIISEVTGLPPASTATQYTSNVTVPKGTDFRDNVESQDEYFGRK